MVASGNFSLTAAMCQAAALLAARHLPQWEVIDYASAGKPDVPSGTARELAERLGEVRRPAIGRPVDEIHGPREARGADVAGTQVHSVRLPSFVVSTEVVFGAPDERLTIRHDAGGTPEPYVAGTLLAVRKVRGASGSRAGSTRCCSPPAEKRALPRRSSILVRAARSVAPMNAYAIAHLRDVRVGPDIVQYLERIDATLAPFGGHFIVHASSADVLEGEWPGP